MAESFHEYRFVRQVPGEPRLRWFQNDYFELFVWFGDDDAPCAFRLCYDRGYREHAISWEREKRRIRHQSVDDGESCRVHARSPILKESRSTFPPAVIDRFAATHGEIPEDLRALVINELQSAAMKTRAVSRKFL